MGARDYERTVRRGIKGMYLAFGATMMTAAPAGAEANTYVVGGIGFLSVAGDADAAAQRDAGWSATGGLRRRLTERLMIGVSGQYGRADLNAKEFFDDREIFLSEPERHLTGGKLTVLAGSLDGIYEYPIDRSTVVYGKLGIGYYQWSVEDIFVDTEDPGIPDEVPSQILFEDESGLGGNVAIGLRFPIGESAGLWAELAVELISGASGGSMQLVPLRAGISLP